MDGLFFLLSIVATGLVLYWVVTNDRVAPDQPTRGLFAMTDETRRALKKSLAWQPPVAPQRPAEQPLDRTPRRP